MPELLNPFTQRFSEVAEKKIKEEKNERVRTNAFYLTKNNVDFFGSRDEEKRSEVATKILDEFGRGYRNVDDIKAAVNDPNRDNRRAEADLVSLSESVFIAMNLSVSGEENNLITDLMTPEQIDENLPKQFKGIGEEIIKIILVNADRYSLVKTNETVDKTDLFVSKGANSREEIYKKWDETVKELPENSLVKQYLEVGKLVLNDLGIEVNRQEKSQSVLMETAERMVKATEGMTESVQKLLAKYNISPDAYLKARGDDWSGFKPRPRTNADGEFEGYENGWVVSETKLAEAMKYMADDLRWSSWTPPDWFKKKDPIEQARMEFMIMVNDGASFLKKFQNADLDKCRLNPLYTAWNNESFSTLFNEDFKLVSSKLIHDLCEIYVNKDGVRTTGFKQKDGNLDPDVKDKLFHLNNYKEELALFLAKKNGREKPNPMDLMNAYTAWNIRFLFGDTSFMDNRLRAVPPAAGIVSDKLRTLNPEAKSRKKWRMVDKMKLVDQKTLIASEWFGGPVATWVQSIAQNEFDAGEALDKKTGKTLQEKIAEGDFELFSNVSCYGLFDVIGSDKLFDKDGISLEEKNKKTTLSQLLWNYADYNEGTKEFNKKERDLSKLEGMDFSFGNSQMDFLSDFRDMQETAVRSFNVITGKMPADKGPESVINELRSSVGEAENIKLNGLPLLRYSRRPEFWGLAMVGAFGVDLSRLSTDHIYIKLPKGHAESSYNIYIGTFLKNQLLLRDSSDFSVKEIMKYLGCVATHYPNYGLDRTNTINQMLRDYRRTQELGRRAEKRISEFGFTSLINNLPKEIETVQNEELNEMYQNWKRAAKVRDAISADRLREEIVERFEQIRKQLNTTNAVLA